MTHGERVTDRGADYKKRSDPSLTNPTDKRFRMGAGVLVVITLAAYIPAIGGGYVFDDDTYLTHNPTIRTTAGLRDIWSKPSASPQYYPLVFTTFWVEYRLWLLSAVGYHLVNVLLHAAGAVMLWRLLRRLHVPGAWLAAGIFALHPVHVQSVAWIVERKNVLSGVFYLSALLAYLRFSGLGAGTGGGGSSLAEAHRRWFYPLALGCFLCALLSKSVTCSLPAAILLLLWWKRGRLIWLEVLGLTPFFLLGLASGLTTAWLEKHQVGARGPELDWSFVDSWIIAGRAVWFYAGKLIWPAKLAFIYPRWAIDAGAWWQHLYPLSAAAVPVALWFLRHRIGKAPFVGVLFFMATLAPALGFSKAYAMRCSFVADHWQYHASMGLIALFAGLLVSAPAAINRLARGARAQSEYPQGRPHVPGIVLSLVILPILAVLTWRQAGTYRNLETFWNDALARNPGAWMAHNNLGLLRMEQERLADAIHHFSEAVRLRPEHAIAHANLGKAWTMKGEVDKAIAHCQRALEIDRGCTLAHNNLGVLLARQGQVEEAIAHFRTAVELKPHHPGAHQNLAMALESQGKIKEAVEHYRAAIDCGTNDPTAYNNLAWCLAASPDAQIRHPAEAVRLAQWACRATEHKEPLFLSTLAAAYSQAGRFQEALATARRAHRLAREAGNLDLAEQLETRIELYRDRRPFPEPPRDTGLP